MVVCTQLFSTILCTLCALLVVTDGATSSFIHEVYSNLHELPSIDHKEFVTSIMSQKRNAPNGYFILSGVHLPEEGATHDFLIKESDALSAEVIKDLRLPLMYSGYSTIDPHVTICMFVPIAGSLDKMYGTIRWNNGESNDLHFSADGIQSTLKDGAVLYSLYKLDNLPDVDPVVKFSAEDRLRPTNKRSLLNSGVVCDRTITIKLNVEYDSTYTTRVGIQKHGGAEANIRRIIQMVNDITSRDLCYSFLIDRIGRFGYEGTGDDLKALMNDKVNRRDMSLLFLGTTATGYAGLAYVNALSNPDYSGCWVTDCSNDGTTDDGDIAVVGQETNHVVAFGHTHDDTTLGSQWIDTCGNGGSLPRTSTGAAGQGIIMSYCHLARDCNRGWGCISHSFGEVGQYGDRSERCSTRIWQTLKAFDNSRGNVPSGGGTTNPPPTNPPPPTSCWDDIGQYAQYGTCQQFAAWGNGWCEYVNPSCAKSCNRCTAPPPPPPTTCYDDIGKYSQYGTCAQFAAWGNGWCEYVNPSCAKSCGRCRKRGVEDVEESLQVLQSTPESSPVVLFDQGGTCATNKGLPSCLFSNSKGYVRALDDFVIPQGRKWTLQDVSIMGKWKGLLPTLPVLFSVTIFNRGRHLSTSRAYIDPPKSAQIEAKLVLQPPITLIGAHLENETVVPSEETYYITVAPDVDYVNKKHTFYWSYSQSAKDSTLYWKDEFNILNRNCKKWTNPRDCGYKLHGNGMCFKIVGLDNAIDPTEDNTQYVFRPWVPNGGDGIIGHDGGHHIAVRLNAAKEKKKQRGIVASGLMAIDKMEEGESVEISSLNDGLSPGVIAGIVIASVVLVAVVVGLVVRWRRRATQSEEVA